MIERFGCTVALHAISMVVAAPALLFAGTILPPFDPPTDSIDLGPYRVIRAKSAVVLNGDRQSPAPSVLYDGTGLTDDNPVLAQHGSDPATIWQYPIQSNEYPVAVEFDLGGEFLVHELWLWQLKGEGLEGQGLKEFDIVMRDSARREVGTVTGALEDIKRVGVQPVQRFNAFGECIFLPIPGRVRFVELRIRQNLGDPDWVGLAEVAFGGWGDVPEPSTFLLCLFAGLGVLRRRHKVR